MERVGTIVQNKGHTNLECDGCDWVTHGSGTLLTARSNSWRRIEKQFSPTKAGHNLNPEPDLTLTLPHFLNLKISLSRGMLHKAVEQSPTNYGDPWCFREDDVLISYMDIDNVPAEYRVDDTNSIRWTKLVQIFPFRTRSQLCNRFTALKTRQKNLKESWFVEYVFLINYTDKHTMVYEIHCTYVYVLPLMYFTTCTLYCCTLRYLYCHRVQSTNVPYLMYLTNVL
jgi:hypothetical protein